MRESSVLKLLYTSTWMQVMVHSTLTGMIADRIVLGHLHALKRQYRYMAVEIINHISSDASVSYAVPTYVEILEAHLWTYHDGSMMRKLREDYITAMDQNGWMLDLWTSAMETDNLNIAVGSFLIRLRYDTESLMLMNRDPESRDIKRIYQLVIEKYNSLNGTFFTEDIETLTIPKR